jgi:DNA-binding transcriptional LysR family regulator
VIDNLPNLVAFAQIVSAGSLSAASRELDLSLPVISKRLAQLEKSLGVRLVQRTTRRLTLTEEGELFHGQVLRILAEIEEAETLISDRRDVVSGILLMLSEEGELRRSLPSLRRVTRSFLSILS